MTDDELVLKTKAIMTAAAEAIASLGYIRQYTPIQTRRHLLDCADRQLANAQLSLESLYNELEQERK